MDRITLGKTYAGPKGHYRVRRRRSRLGKEIVLEWGRDLKVEYEEEGIPWFGAPNGSDPRFIVSYCWTFPSTSKGREDAEDLLRSKVGA